MKIGEVAALLGRKPLTVRVWEKQGWIDPPGRDSRKWREYSEADVVKIIENIRGRNIFLPYKAIEFFEAKKEM